MRRNRLVHVITALSFCIVPWLQASEPVQRSSGSDKPSDIVLVDTVHTSSLPPWLQLGGQYVMLVGNF